MACFARPDAPNPPVRSEEWDPGETVTLRPRLTWAMEAEAQARSMKVPEGVDLSQLAPAEIASVLQKNMDATASLQYKFEAMILEWTLTYDDGQPAPYTPALLAQMPKGYADWIAEEIERRGGAVSRGVDAGPLAMTSAPKLDLPSGTASSTALDGSRTGRSTKPA